MANVNFVYTITDGNGKYYSFHEKHSQSANLKQFCELMSSKYVVNVMFCESEKQAIGIANNWNNSYLQNGTEISSCEEIEAVWDKIREEINV